MHHRMQVQSLINDYWFTLNSPLDEYLAACWLVTGGCAGDILAVEAGAGTQAAGQGGPARGSC